MPREVNILKNNNGEKYIKNPNIAYADTEFFLEKIDICHNNH